MDGRPTRRQLFGGGITAAGGALAGGGVGALLGGASAAAAALDETRAIRHALAIEQLVLIAYRQVVGSAVLTTTVRAQLTTMRDQEVQHVNLLVGALTQRGKSVPTAPGLAEAQAALLHHDVHWSLTHLPNQHDCLKLLVDVESLAENAYFEAIGAVRDPGLVRACAGAMGCEAQHWTVLSGLLNHQDATRAVPYPFVEGTP